MIWIKVEVSQKSQNFLVSLVANFSLKKIITELVWSFGHYGTKSNSHTRGISKSCVLSMANPNSVEYSVRKHGVAEWDLWITGSDLDSSSSQTTWFCAGILFLPKFNKCIPVFKQTEALYLQRNIEIICSLNFQIIISTDPFFRTMFF